MEFFLKIYMEDDDTIVFEGQGESEKDGYYPAGNGRIGTVVVGAEHIAITKEAKEAFRTIVCRAHHTGDDLSCLDIHTCYGKNEDGSVDVNGGEREVCLSYLGPVRTVWKVSEVIKDSQFYIGCGEGAPKLHLLDRLTSFSQDDVHADKAVNTDAT